jgi:hypothetical protein
VERYLKIKLDTDYRAMRRLVRTGWGALISGSVIEIQLDSDTPWPKWVRCRIERWANDSLLVSKCS